MTGFYRSRGNQKNGFAIYNGPGDAGAQIGLSIDDQVAYANAEAIYDPPIFSSAVTPSLTPAPVSGLCPNQPPPISGLASQTPPDVLEQYGRSIDESCRDGWGPSWAQWPNKNSGGWVCTRTLNYDSSTASWLVR